MRLEYHNLIIWTHPTHWWSVTSHRIKDEIPERNNYDIHIFIDISQDNL